MKAIVKVLVPATLAFGVIGAASAQSFVVETDYPGPVVQSAASTATRMMCDVSMGQSLM